MGLKSNRVIFLLMIGLFLLGMAMSDSGKLVKAENDEPVYVLATDDDFEGSYNGGFRYIGNDEYVEIPHTIKGVAVTSYKEMFSFIHGAKPNNVKGVKSTNKNVTDMSLMFYHNNSTSLDLSSFDTSNVTNMNFMFNFSLATTLDLSSFDTSKVTNMKSMFQNSRATTLDLSSFDTSNVTDMSLMFHSSSARTLNLSSFDTSNVMLMDYMFQDSHATTLDLSSFDTSNVKQMNGMFQGSRATTLDLSSFDTRSVTNMTYMFTDSQATMGYARTQADADRFNVSPFKPSQLVFKVRDGYVLATDDDFEGVTNGDFWYIGNDEYIEIPHTIKGKNITSYTGMFRNTSVKGVKSTNKNVTDMSYMFADSQSTTLDLSSFDTRNVTNMDNMFSSSQATMGYAQTQADADRFNGVSTKLIFKVRDADDYVLATDGDFQGVSNGGFRYIGSDKYVEIPHTIKGQNITSYQAMFQNTSVKGVKSTNKNVTDMNNMFKDSKATTLDLRFLDTKSVIDMSYMFYNNQATLLDLSSFDTGIVEDMHGMFHSSEAIELDLSSFDTKNVTDMGSMFLGSYATELDMSSFDTSNVTNMMAMFQSSRATSLDLTNFNTSKVTAMVSMFQASRATSLDLNNFNTSKVTDMMHMFLESEAITLDVSSFDTSNVTNMGRMFQRSKATLLDLSSFDTSNVTTMTSMFLQSQATKGYARTQKDADNFNKTYLKPKNLIFRIIGSPEINFETDGNNNYAQTHSTKVEVEAFRDNLDKLQYQWTESKNFPTSGTWTDFQSNDILSIKNATGDYYLHIKATSKSGITTEATSKDFKLDNDAPTLILSASTEDATNQDVIITATATDKHSGIKQIREKNGDWEEAIEMTFSVPENGTYTFEVEDNAGNEIIKTIKITNIDKTVPSSPIINGSDGWQSNNQTITITHGTDTGGSGVKKTEYRIGKDGTWLTYDKSFAISWEGKTTIYARTIDKAGNISKTAKSIVQIDRTAPTLTLRGQNPLTLLHGNKFTDPGYKVEDNFDDNVIVNKIGGVDSKSVGTYNITYKATDHMGNTTTVTRTVYVVDAEQPLITLIGNNPLIIEVGMKYDELGATAEDNVDGDISEQITITGKVDTSKLGVYEIRYNVTDNEGNEAVEVVRKVYVVAKTDTLELDEQAVPIDTGSLVKIKNTDTTIQLPSDLPAGTKLQVVKVQVEEPENLQLAGEVYDFIFTYPDGQKDYHGDFILTMGVDETVDNPALYHFQGTWERVGGTLDGNKITATVSDFSMYAVFAEKEMEEEIEKKPSNLPVTATNQYNWLIAGIILMILGSTLWFIYRKGKHQEEHR